MCYLPGDVKKGKSNTVLDEDGEIAHIKHRLADEKRRGRG